VGRFDTDQAGYTAMLAVGRGHGVKGERVWAVEGCNGIGRHIAHRLVHDGERRVVDVPPKLSAQVRIFATGNARKTDPVDAHSVALAALYAPAEPGLRPVLVEDDLLVMGLMVDRRDELGRARTQTVNRLHRLLLELIPGGAKTFLSAPQARALVATVKPRDLVGKTRRRFVVELEGIDRKIKAAEKALTPTRPAHNPTPALRTSLFPDPSPASVEPRPPPCLDLKGCHERMLRCRGALPWNRALQTARTDFSP